MCHVSTIATICISGADGELEQVTGRKSQAGQIKILFHGTVFQTLALKFRIFCKFVSQYLFHLHEAEILS